MESLQELGKIAGIAGIAVGAFVLIFRDVIARTANLPPAKASRLLNTIVVLSFVLAIVGVGAWFGAEAQPSSERIAAESQAECLAKLSEASPDKPASSAIIDAGSSVKAGNKITITADKLDSTFIKARCGDVSAQDIEAIIGMANSSNATNPK